MSTLFEQWPLILFLVNNYIRLSGFRVACRLRPSRIQTDTVFLLPKVPGAGAALSRFSVNAKLSRAHSREAWKGLSKDAWAREWLLDFLSI